MSDLCTEAATLAPNDSMPWKVRGVAEPSGRKSYRQSVPMTSTLPVKGHGGSAWRRESD